MTTPSITCPYCGMTSYHPVDIKERYCGNCHRFHDEPPDTFGDLDYHAHDNERDKSLWRSLRRETKPGPKDTPGAPEETR